MSHVRLPEWLSQLVADTPHTPAQERYRLNTAEVTGFGFPAHARLEEAELARAGKNPLATL